MKVEKITNKRNKVEILFDNKQKLELLYDVYLSNLLYEDDEIDSSFLNKLKNENNQMLARDYALRLISRKMYTKHEINQKLINKYDNTIAKKTVAYLEENGFIDDKQFAKLYTEELIYKGSGKYKISYMLKQKGISKSLIDHEIESLDKETEAETAKKVATNKYNSIKYLDDDKKIKQRLISHLQSKGFSYDIIMNAISSLKEEC